MIVSTASMAGEMDAPLLAHHSASKFAVVSFTQSLHKWAGATAPA